MICKTNVPPQTEKVYITTIRVNQTTTSPGSIINRSVDEGGIEAILANSHRYLAKYTSAGTVTICQLNDDDSNYYFDGTPAILTGAEGDVFMRLPKFYYKAVEAATDKWDISFCYAKEKPDDSWKVWDGNDLIGVYKSIMQGTVLYSISGVRPSSNGYAYIKQAAKNKGEGFSLVKWKHHCMMGFLYYAVSDTTASKLGYGHNYSTISNFVTGISNNYGMKHAKIKVTSNEYAHNYWGLEDWWGYYNEWFENVSGAGYYSIKITEDDGTTRTLGGGFTQTEGYPSKMTIGEHLDLYPKTLSGSTSTGYCTHFTGASSSSGTIALRSGIGTSNNYGAAFAACNYVSAYVGEGCASRLCFKGNIVEEKNVTRYKSI